MEWVMGFFDQYGTLLLMESLGLNILVIIFLIVSIGTNSNLRISIEKLVEEPTRKQIEEFCLNILTSGRCT